MSIAQSLLPEFDHEMATTRSLLERVPEGKASWQPHKKSMTMGRLAMHLADLPKWTVLTLTTTELDINPPGGPGFAPTPFESTRALLAEFDANVKAARSAIVGASDAELFVPWSLKDGGHVTLTMPRAAVLRSFVLNHLVHHRGQLSVYLRLNDVPLPMMYGPTADTK
jgi:uncharacterized damage-inducible protein DinB